MRLLLDTSAFLWWRDQSPRLSTKARDEIGNPDNDVMVSIVSLWEIAIKRGIGKLQFLEDFEQVMAEEEFDLLPITYAHLRALETLPPHRHDPFDRLLVAQSTAERLPIITADDAFSAYGAEVIW